MALSAGSASGIDVWTGGTSTDWTDGSNWDLGRTPNPGEIVNFGNLGFVTPLHPAVIGVGGAVSVSVGGMFIGNNSTVPAVLTIQNGSVLTSTSSTRLAVGAGSTGIVTVTGPGSQWNIATTLGFGIAFAGTGTLNIQDGGEVVTGGSTAVSRGAATSGTLNISGGGALETDSLQGGTGAAQANFDNGTLRAGASSATFINGFSGSELNLLAGGIAIDTNGFTIGTDAASGFTGVGGLTVTGGGVFSLLADSTYAGETRIEAGSVLSLFGAGAINNSSRVVADGTLDVSGAAAAPIFQTLAGSGVVLLGPQTLTIANANDSFSGEIAGTGGLILTGGTQTLAGTNSYTGATTVSGGRLAVNGSITSSVGTSGAGTLGGTGTIFGDVSNAGVVAPGNSIGTLTIAGNYTGVGGTLEMETVLGGDASPTDLLHVTGNTTGNTNVRVINVGGAGASTTEGIRIVQVDGLSAGDFALLGDYVFEGDQAVVAGAYAYRLYQGSVTTPADGDWYLRSALLPVVAPPGPGAGPVAPLYQPGVPLYEAYGGALQAFNELGTLQQRAGKRTWAAGAEEDGYGLWAEISAAGASLNPETSTSSTSYDTATWKLKAGVDTELGAFAGGRLIGGANLQYGTLGADVSSLYGDGSIDGNGYGFGASLTWYGDNGFYLDGQGQVSWFNSSLHSSTAGLALVNDNDGFGYAVSLEAGQQIAIAPEWSMTPQAQLSYSSVEFDDFTDAFGAPVSLDESNSLIARVGLSLDRQTEWKDDLGRTSRSHLYGIANLYYPIEASKGVDVAGVDFETSDDGLWGGIGVGGTLSLDDDKYAIHGEALAKTNLADFGDSYSLSGTVGFKVRF